MSKFSSRRAMIFGSIAGFAAMALPAISGEPYTGAPRTYLYNPDTEVCFKDTSQYKKNGPYTIDFSNAGLGDSWLVVMLHSVQTAASPPIISSPS